MRMMNLNERIAALRHRIAGGEGGFTVTELAAAFAILLLALTALARTATVAFSDVSNARQRQSGNQLANQLLEEVRGLPFDTVKKGHATSDLDGDPRVVRCAGNVYRYRSCSGERMVHTAYPTGTSISPLVPNSGTVGPPATPSTYTWRSYVTELAGAPAQGAYRVRVAVDWTSVGRSGTKTELEVETFVYSPQGCIDTASHPFGAPCQPYYYGTGSVGGGTLTVSGPFSAEGGGGADYDSMTATLLGETADAQIEQVSLVQGNVSLPQIARVVDGVESSVPDGAASAADGDPSTPTGTYQRQTAGPQSGSSYRVQDGPDRMDLILGSSSSGETTSTTAAGGGNACNLQVDGKPCGFASGTQNGGISLEGRLQDGGDVSFFSVGTLPSSPVTTYLRRYQPSASENGLLRETVTWRVPEIRIGGLPADLGAPSGWAGYWVRLRDFSATAVAEAGTSTTAPTVTINSGTIDYWHGNGYSSASVAADPATGAARTAAFTVPINSFTRQVSSGGDQLRVEISGTVTIDPSLVAETITTGTTRTEAQATIGSPLVAEVSYVMKEDGDTVHDLTFDVNAGQGAVTTTYRPTPAG